MLSTLCTFCAHAGSRPALAAITDDLGHENAAALLTAVDEVLKSQPTNEDARLRRAEALVLCSRYVCVGFHSCVCQVDEDE